MNFVIVAGEVSGDLHGANLMQALKHQFNPVSFSGIGGDRMKDEGLDALYTIDQMAFLGIGEILRHLPFIRNVFKTLLQHIREKQPTAVILIDYPGFNLRLARRIHALGIPVIYYISPQLWAWGRRRVRQIRKYVDRMLVIFPFEVDFYADYGIRADYVGHPLVDRYHDSVKPKTSSRNERVLGLLPGSRRHETDSLLPNMLATADILQRQGDIDQVLIAAVTHIGPDEYQQHIGERSFVSLFNGDKKDFYNSLDAALVKSGTSTLETAYFQVPFVIVYRVSRLTWMLGNMLVKLDSIGLANIVAGEQVAEEFLQADFTPQKTAAALSPLLREPENTRRREKLKIIGEKLGNPGAAENAAKMIREFVPDR